MRLSALFQGLAVLPSGADDIEVSAVTLDSRQVHPGVVFVASRGVTSSSKDGHAFVNAAVQAGASAVVVEVAVPCSAPTIISTNARILAARLAERINGRPSQHLKVAGVTGTNGKTTTTFLLAAIARAAQQRAAVFGTLGVGAPEHLQVSGFTTPEAEVLSARLAAMQREGFDVVAMEVSSHALATARVDGLTFAAAGFTNLSHDHLDFHGDFERYFQAKERLFSELLAGDGAAVLPADDDEQGLHARLRQHCKDAVTWGRGPQARLRALDVRSSAAGLAFNLQFDGSATVEVVAPALLGTFNVDNALVAAGLGLGLGFSLLQVADGLRAAAPPPGRMQKVLGDEGSPLVVVDYAHTPDALERALLTARGFTSGKLFVVFGCGGDRDAAKRPAMGRVAADVADFVIITDDNPRSEDSALILDAIAGGIAAAGSHQQVELAALGGSHAWARQPNRRLAIRASVRAAGEGDVVVIAGKGHEREQITKGVQAPFDDVVEAGAALSSSSRPALLPRAFVEATLGGSFGADTPAVFAGVSTDSRALERGTLFVPLVGDTFDGHTFVAEALTRGAAAVLVQRSALGNMGTLPSAGLLVPDTLRALQELAGAWLATMPARRIALTGSNGKTTTKELISAAIGAVVGADGVLATEGNLNNHIGVPLTALCVEPHHAFAVLEMGMNHLDEIAGYCRFARPHIGLVTNMGTAHAGNVGGVEGVARAKAELFAALPKDGVAVVNADDARCLREAVKAACRHISFGTAPFADVRLLAVRPVEQGGQLLSLSYNSKIVEVFLPLDGRHNALNAAGAVAVAVAAGLDFARAAAGLANAQAAHGRLERRRRVDGLLVLDDSYNANPDSMEAGLETLGAIGASATVRPTVAALGPMLELGDHAPAAHRHIGAAAALAGVRALFVCGELGRFFEEGARAAGLTEVVWAVDSAALAPLVAAATRPSDVVLVKGSRGARMERVVGALLQNMQPHQPPSLPPVKLAEDG